MSEGRQEGEGAVEELGRRFPLCSPSLHLELRRLVRAKRLRCLMAKDQEEEK